MVDLSRREREVLQLLIEAGENGVLQRAEAGKPYFVFGHPRLWSSNQAGCWMRTRLRLEWKGLIRKEHPGSSASYVLTEEGRKRDNG